MTSSDENPERRLILISGQEGAGKTTIIRALLPHTPREAQVVAAVMRGIPEIYGGQGAT
ncbi:ATP-binding protein [Nonomuraea sp. NPDC049714]|uniref:ATP-binding protein n=1 Tax=Nonomuraea sp. NPDC049714 TaxID=3364357 RepID=UPI00379563B8